MSGRNHPEYREQLQTKNPAESTASKIPSSGDHPDFHDPLTPHLGKTCLDLGKQPMKLGKRRPIRATPDTSGTLPLKMRQPRKSARRARSGDQLDPRSTKGENASAAKYGRQRYRATNGKNRQPGSNYVAPACLIPADESAASYGPA